MEGRDRRVALRALTLLDRHLNYPRTIKLTQALGMDDATLLNIGAINWHATARVTDGAPRLEAQIARASHQRDTDLQSVNKKVQYVYKHF